MKFQLQSVLTLSEIDEVPFSTGEHSLQPEDLFFLLACPRLCRPRLLIPLLDLFPQAELGALGLPESALQAAEALRQPLAGVRLGLLQPLPVLLALRELPQQLLHLEAQLPVQLLLRESQGLFFLEE